MSQQLEPDVDASEVLEGPVPGRPELAAWDRYRLLSIDFSLQSVDLAIAEAVRWHLAPFLVRGLVYTKHSVQILVQPEDKEFEPPFFSCFVDRVFKEKSPHRHDMVRAALDAIYGTTLELTRDFLILHAGGVVRDGGAVLMPARPDAGKSSTTLALLRTRAFAYLSDEHVAIDPVTGHAYPFPRPISIDDDAVSRFDGLEAALMDKREMSVWQLGRHVRPQDVDAELASPSPIRWIVFPSYDREGPPVLTEIPSAEAVVAMAGNCFNLSVYDERGLHLLTRVTEGAQAFRLQGGSPDERALLLFERLM